MATDIVLGFCVGCLRLRLRCVYIVLDFRNADNDADEENAYAVVMLMMGITIMVMMASMVKMTSMC